MLAHFNLYTCLFLSFIKIQITNIALLFVPLAVAVEELLTDVWCPGDGPRGTIFFFLTVYRRKLAIEQHKRNICPVLPTQICTYEDQITEFAQFAAAETTCLQAVLSHLQRKNTRPSYLTSCKRPQPLILTDVEDNQKQLTNQRKENTNMYNGRVQ